MFLISLSAFSQKAAGVDSALLKKGKGYMKGVGNELKKEKSKLKNQLMDYASPLKFLTDSSNRKIELKGSVVTEAEYLSNSYLPASANGMYYKGGLNLSMNVGKLPFSVGVMFNFRNNHFWMDYSMMNFSFDSRKYTDELKSSYLDYIGDLKNIYPPEIANPLSAYKDSMQRLDDLKTTLTSQDYYSTLKSFGTQLKPLQDSLQKYPGDSCIKKEYDAVSDSIKRYKGLSKEYSDLNKYRYDNRHMEKKLEVYNQYVDSVKNITNIATLPEVQKQLSDNKLVSKATKFFSGVQKFGLGRVALNLSDNTIRGQSIYGFNFDYLIKGIYYVGTGLGLTSPNNFQFSQFAQYQNQFSQFKTPKVLGYLRFGLGAANDDHLHLIYTSYGERFRGDSTTLIFPKAPHANSVLALVYRKKIAKEFGVEGELATSNSNFLDRYATFSPFEVKGSKNFNYAAKSVFSGTIAKTSTSFAAKINLASDKFLSAGNLFMRRDFVEYGLNLSQPLLDGKFNFNSILNHNFTGVMSGRNKQSYLTSINSLAVSAFSNARYVLGYTLVKQFAGSDSKGLTMHATSLQQQYNYGREKIQGNTIINSNYTLSNVNFREQRPFKSHQVQNSVIQLVNFPKGIAFSIGGGCLATISDVYPLQLSYWVETGNKFNIKSKVALGYNFKYLKDNIGLSNYFITNFITTQLFKCLQINFKGQYQIIPGRAANNLNMQVSGGLTYNWQYSLPAKWFAKKKSAKHFNLDKVMDF